MSDQKADQPVASNRGDSTANDSKRSRSRSRDKKATLNCKYKSQILANPNSIILNSVQRDDNVALKIRGFPWQVTDEDVVQFFDGYKLVPDSIKIERGDDDRITGWGAALFETEEEAERAMNERQKECIGTRWI